MKLKASFLLSGLIAVTVVISPIVFYFNSASADPIPTAERKNEFQELDLTDSQTGQIEKIRQYSHQQAFTILNDDQKKQVEIDKPPKHNLNLSDFQKAQLRSIRENERSQIDAILTPAQKEQLNTERSNWYQQHPNTSPQ